MSRSMKSLEETFESIITEEYTARDIEFDLYGNNIYYRKFLGMNYRIVEGRLPNKKRYGSETFWYFTNGEVNDRQCSSMLKYKYSNSLKAQALIKFTCKEIISAEQGYQNAYYVHATGGSDGLPVDYNPETFCDPKCAMKWKSQDYIDLMAKEEQERLDNE
tara:strand:- start:3553 stop:4035 length:483 start_codon:yes stop_codon:yes gene_type:complete